MSLKTLNGDQAMAYGALSSGIKLVTSYPGSPSSGTVETLIARACGVKHVYTSGPDNLDSTLKKTFREALRHRELSLIIIRIESRAQKR